MPLNLAGCGLRAFFCIAISLFCIVRAEDPYRFFNWNVTYGDIYPLGVRQQVCWKCDDFSGILWYGVRLYWIWIRWDWSVFRVFSSTANSQVLIFTLSPTTISLSMSLTACLSPSSSPGNISLSLSLSRQRLCSRELYFSRNDYVPWFACPSVKRQNCPVQ